MAINSTKNPRTTDESAAEISGRKKAKVLIVDDEKNLRESLVELVESENLLGTLKRGL